MKNLQKIQVFAKKYKNFKVVGKNCKISKFLEQTANFWKEQQKYQDFG